MKTNKVMKVMVMMMLVLSVCFCMAGCGDSDDKEKAVEIGTCTISISNQLEETLYDVTEGDTVYDILMKTRLAVSAVDTGNGMAVEAIGGISSGEKGKHSGWLFTVNGEMPMDYSDKVEVKDGDEIVWKFAKGM